MGRFLGEPEVWDDTPGHPRTVPRALAALLAGAVAGLLVTLAIAPRPAPAVGSIEVPRPPAASGSVLVASQPFLDQLANEGSVLYAGVGRLEVAGADGSAQRAVADFVPVAVVPGAGSGPVAALGGGAVVSVAATGLVRRLTPDGLTAQGLAGDGRRAVACGRRRPAAGHVLPGAPVGADGTAAAPSLLLSLSGQPSVELPVGCPVAWAQQAPLLAGTAGPQLPAGTGTRGTQVLAGPPGGPLKVVVTPSQVDAAAGPRASVALVALSADGRLLATAVGSPGGPWSVLVGRASGGGLLRLPLAPGYEAAWLGWSPQGELAVAVLDRRGQLALAPLANRDGDGYVLAWDGRDRSTSVLAAGPPLVDADGFGWSPTGLSFAVSSPPGWTIVDVAAPAHRTTVPLAGTLLGWYLQGGP